MVYKLDPLDVSLDFERRPFRRGDTINATVTLIPNSDVEIRTASLSLMGQVRRTKVGMGRSMGINGGAALQGGNSFTSTDYVPMQQTTDQKKSNESFDSRPLLHTKSLRKGDVSRHDVALKIGPRVQNLVREAKELQRDANSSISIEPWWLEVQVDVVMGRDVRVQRQIEIIAPLKATT